MCQTRERMFHQDIQTLRSVLNKRGAAKFLNLPRGVWIPAETLFIEKGKPQHLLCIRITL